jgi:uncharacterized protein YndB with AHSA1/START domain
MSDFGMSPKPGEVRFERVLPGPIERIWAYLTDAEKRALWFAGGPMDLRPGGRLVLKFQHKNLSETPDEPPEAYRQVNDVGIESELKVVRAEPPRLVAFTFDEDEDPSIVTIELTPEGDDVRLVLTHSNLKSRQGMLDVSGGWHAHLEVLGYLAAGKPRPPFWAMWRTFQGQYESRLPA